jgi:hypothetical protein
VLYPASGAAFRDLGTVYAKYAQFAMEDHQPSKQMQYLRLARDAWANAINNNAPQDQSIYPKLTSLELQVFHDYCAAGTYAQQGLQLLQNKTLADSTGQYAALFQQAIAAAHSHGCKQAAP